MVKEFVTIDGSPPQLLEEANEWDRRTGHIEMEYRKNGSGRFVTFLTNSHIEMDDGHNQNLLNGVDRRDKQRFVNFTTDNRLSYKSRLKDGNIVNLDGTVSYTILDNRLSVLTQSSQSRSRYRDGSMMVATDFIFKGLGLRMNCQTGLEYNFKELSTRMAESDSYTEHRLGLRLSPGIDYSFKQFRINLAIPVGIVYRGYGGRQAVSLLPEGTLFMTYRPDSYWQFSLNTLYSLKLNGFFDLVPIPFYTSFESERRGSGLLYRSSNFSSTLNINFSDMIKGWSTYLRSNVMYVSKSPLVRSTLSEDGTSVLETTGRYRPTLNIFTRSQIAKRIRLLNSPVSLTGSLGYTLEAVFRVTRCILWTLITGVLG